MTVKHLLISLTFSWAACALFAQKTVSHERMQQIYDNSRTPYKYGMVVAPQTNDRKFDCPTVFRKDGHWYMTYVCYNGKGGTDGRGYETWLAKSDDLLSWETLGRILEFPEGKTWDENQRGGFPSLIDYEWGGTYEMQAYKGRHWITYIGGPGTGYEAVNSPLSIGIASTAGDITKAHPWECQPSPLMSYNDRDAQWWEYMTQYKSTIYKMDKKWLGKPFVMFYNAGGKNDSLPKGERIGIALSKDMKKWTRYEGNPVFAHDSDGTITGDAQIVRMGDVWVMYYFSAFNPTRKYNAYNTFAASYDLVNWTDWDGADLIIPSKPYDEMFAHKSYVVKWNDTVYHFYCAVNNSGQRGIAVATSKPLGKSEVSFPEPDQTGHRYIQDLGNGWTIEESPNPSFPNGTQVNVPFNLDDYYGNMQGEHGNLHGNAVVSKTFSIPSELKGKQIFIRFEGVGTYADITLNGQSLGRHDIGRTTETIDITEQARIGGDNFLRLAISHPSGITDMPWVCGGCSSEWGFSEGTQPFGIFRPVILESTDKIRIEPFGVHAWSNLALDTLNIDTEIRNYGAETASFQLISKLCEKSGKQVIRLTDEITLQPGETKTVRQAGGISHPTLWTQEEPYLYNINTIIKRNGKATESTNTAFGFRTAAWPTSANRPDDSNRFFLNGKPVFINGVCEYEHLFGQSHAFRNEQIDARIKEVKGAGFNAFRDAHQPHNLRYGDRLAEEGILWWPQFSAHIWYDTPEFRESFKRHLRQWVKERRNNPANVLWGLQNESTMPADFSSECCDIIRQMDPSCGTSRLITTCNGGEGTDWNVIQNWSGTYGGSADNYASELKQKEQLLNGEYGCWRTLGNHTGNDYTEEKYCELLEKKALLAESARDSVCGHFLWLLGSHDNPGRRQPDEALRRIDKAGPYNYKGLFTPWEQPVDGYYMYKSHYISADEEPFVYIRGAQGKGGFDGKPSFYSNCDEVRIKDNNGIITATGWIGGYEVARDAVARPEWKDWNDDILKPTDGRTYIHRINCGGDDYTDRWGNTWHQDNNTVSHSWGDRFDSISTYQTSQTYSPYLLANPVMRTARFGRHELKYTIPAKPGEYDIDFYFCEPWYGRGASEQTDCEGLRIFDVAVNGTTVLNDLDIWAQARYGTPYKRTIHVNNIDDSITVTFPEVKAGQAIISAIAVSTHETGAKPLDYRNSDPLWSAMEEDFMTKTPDSLLPPKKNSALEVEGKLTGKGNKSRLEFDFNVGVAKVYALRLRYWNPEMARQAHIKITDVKGVVYRDDDITLLQTQAKPTKRKMTSLTTGSMINAGTYHVVVTGTDLDKLVFEKLTIE